MTLHPDHTRCAALVERRDAEERWGLSEAQRARYTQQLAPLLPVNASDERIRLMIDYYHREHQLVEILRDPHHPEHLRAWEEWSRRTLAALRKLRLGSAGDAAIDEEDLAQIARAEIARALPSFRYGSLFSTWAYQVTARSVRRALRDRNAEKRKIRPDSLDTLDEPAVPLAEAQHPDALVTAALLRGQIWAVLAAQPDKRLARMFELWSIHDLSAERIGQIVQLHPTRVRVLLAAARQALRADPGIRSWVEGPPGSAA